MDEHEKIRELEEMMRKARYNKATEKWFGEIMVKIAKLKEKIEKRVSQKKRGKGFFVKKSGDASVVIVGFPSVGKSTLLNALTGSGSKVGSYAFTTLDVVPGVMKVGGANIQLLDVPGIIEGASLGRGRGKEVLAMARNCDLILFVVESLHPEHYPVLLREVHGVNIRINERAPDVKIVKKSKDGIRISSTVKLTKVSKETLASVLRQMKIVNADVVIRDDIELGQFIDVLAGNRSYIPGIVAVTKADLVSGKRAAEIMKDLNAVAMVSVVENRGVEDLKLAIFRALDFVRIYLKEVNRDPDLDEPLVLRRPVTLRSVCEHIHRGFVRRFRYARVWGKSAKFPGQRFQKLDRVLEDGDIVEVHVT